MLRKLRRFLRKMSGYRLKFTSIQGRTEWYKKHTEARIGERCRIYCDFPSGDETYLLQIGNDVVLTSGVRLITHDGSVAVFMPLGWEKAPAKYGKIVIGNNVFVGNYTIILPGVSIGDNVIVGAGSVVTHDLPSNTVCAGNPARVIRDLKDYYQKVKDDLFPTRFMHGEEEKEYLKKAGFLDAE